MPPTKRVPTRKANSPLFSKPIPTLKPVPAPVTTTTTRNRKTPLPARQRSILLNGIPTPPPVVPVFTPPPVVPVRPPSGLTPPTITLPNAPLFTSGPVIREISSTVLTPNILLPQTPTIVPVRLPPQQPIDTSISSNPLSNNTGGSINQPSIFPAYAETDTVVTEGIDNKTTMLIIAGIVCGIIILKKI